MPPRLLVSAVFGATPLAERFERAGHTRCGSAAGSLPSGSASARCSCSCSAFGSKPSAVNGTSGTGVTA